jgi:putative ABC transport system substrate-binding protein
MRRLAFLFVMLAAPVAAQTTGGKVYRLGELVGPPVSLEITRKFTMPELARLGFSEGKNLVLEERAGELASLPQLARDLVLTKPDAIIAIGPDAIRAASDATSTVPIVTFGADPVERGLAASHARPGSNITGVAIFAEELDGKRLDLLHAAVPATRRIAALLASTPYRATVEQELRTVAANVGIELLLFEAAGPDDYKPVFAAMRAAGAQALVITASPTFNQDAGLLAELSVDANLPTVCEWAENAHSGCLFGYGPSRPELRRRVAYLVARIFQGASPDTLPIETPTRFEFAINLKTARRLGLTIPPALLAQADDLIE